MPVRDDLDSLSTHWAWDSLSRFWFGASTGGNSIAYRSSSAKPSPETLSLRLTRSGDDIDSNTTLSRGGSFVSNGIKHRDPSWKPGGLRRPSIGLWSGDRTRIIIRRWTSRASLSSTSSPISLITTSNSTCGSGRDLSHPGPPMRTLIQTPSRSGVRAKDCLTLQPEEPSSHPQVDHERSSKEPDEDSVEDSTFGASPAEG